MPNFMDSFSRNPTSLKLNRSTFERNCRHKTSFNEGQLVPFFVDEVLPGDTFKVKTSVLCRLSNPAVRPVMDDMYLDYYFFFVPSRILWKHYEELHGANKTDAWTQTTEFMVPTFRNTSERDDHDFLSYCGVPSGFLNIEGINGLPYAAYLRVYDDWFRDENLILPNPLLTTFYEAGSGVCVTDDSSGSLKNVSRYHDYFSSCLPNPQKGNAVTLPLGTSAPVAVLSHWDGTFSGPASPAGGLPVNFLSASGIGSLKVNDGQASLTPTTITSTGIADLSSATSATINALRSAFQLQRLYEKDARGGTRYTEMLLAHFGVSNGDARLQRPEFLGGNHILLNMTQVSQTAPGGTTSAVGSLGAYSLTGNIDGTFHKSFSEFGYVLGLCCVRVKHSYSQGIPRFLTRRRRFDFYYPAFANLGEQPVYKSELYALSDGGVFGYNEAWADYRYKPDLVTGMLRPGVSTDMTAWTFGDNYSSAPSLSSGWVEESPGNIDQTLAVPSATADQFIADFGVYNSCTRVMPLYSVPGLIDHN